MEIIKKRILDIVPYAKNAKKHDKRQIDNVAEFITELIGAHVRLKL